MKSTSFPTDFLIIGSGVAGLQAAWHASQYGQVTLLTKSNLQVSSSYFAQGGIAAVLNSPDSFQSHKDDTIAAGRELCNEDAVSLLVEEGARRVQELINQGMPFDYSNGSLDMGMEGGHSYRRVLHANGAETGKALVNFLIKQVKGQQNIRIIENAFVFKLLTNDESCQGVNAFLYKENCLLNVQSPITILATGGYSGLYQRSTNPHTSTGDGLWLANNIGVELQDLELVQFHPTAFYAEDSPTFLISEALRGEGAHLYNNEDERFMMDYPQQELSPRDVVSKEIIQQIQQSEIDNVYLDLCHLDTEKIRTQFPSIIDKIEQQGINIDKDGIPVAPAAHYCVGGIATNLDAETSIRGLYACGEVAATGVHGANRLASNSLLECLVFGKRAIEHASNRIRFNSRNSKKRDNEFFVDSTIENKFLELQNFVSDVLSHHVSIFRNRDGLEEGLSQINSCKQKLRDNNKEYFSVRSRGLLNIAELIIKSALNREESRGVHLRSDFPEKKSEVRHTIYSNQSRAEASF